METALGVIMWAAIGYCVVRAVRKAQAGRAAAKATAVAASASEGGQAGAHAETHIHLHIGQGADGAPAVDVGADDEQAKLAAALVLVAASLDRSPGRPELAPVPMQLARPAAARNGAVAR